MSRMSEVAYQVELALQEGCDVSSMIDGLQDMYGLTRAEGLQLINQTSYLLTLDQEQEIMTS